RPTQSPAPKSVQANLSHPARTTDRNASGGLAGNRGDVSKRRYEYSRFARLAVWIPIKPLPRQSAPARLVAFQNGQQGPRAVELKGPFYPGVRQSPGHQPGGANGN